MLAAVGSVSTGSAIDQVATGVEISVGGNAAQAASGELLDPPSSSVVRLTFNQSDWHGGFLRDDYEWYGRPWVALYGAQSDYPRADLRFTLSEQPFGTVVLYLTGLCDETGIKNPIRVAVNTRTIFNGTAWFESWDGTGDGSNAPWTTVVIRIPADFFLPGQNNISVTNRQPGSNFSSPPYVLLGGARLELPGLGVSVD
jgi:hypothetical protein